MGGDGLQVSLVPDGSPFCVDSLNPVHTETEPSLNKLAFSETISFLLSAGPREVWWRVERKEEEGMRMAKVSHHQLEGTLQSRFV